MTTKDLFKRFTTLCQKWPKDNSKAGRDYAEFFRQELGELFPQGELSHIKDIEKLKARLQALERIASNQYYTGNPLRRSSASGMEAWACREAISNEAIKSVREHDETRLIRRLKTNLNVKILK